MSERVLMEQNEIYREALERIFRGSDTTLGESRESAAATYQQIAHDALVAANQLDKTEVEYWIEPIPGSGAVMQAWKAQSKAHGLHWLNNESGKYRGKFQMKPRPCTRKLEGEREEASARFHRHTDSCRTCCEPFDLCPEGNRLLRASVDAGNM